MMGVATPPSVSMPGGSGGAAAAQDPLADLAGGDLGVLERLSAGADRVLDQVADELLELGAAEGDVEVLGAGGVGGDEGEVDLRLHDGGELHLRLLRALLEALQGHAVLAQVSRLALLELLDQPVHDALVEVVAAEVGVAGGGLDVEGAFADLQDGDVEG